MSFPSIIAKSAVNSGYPSAATGSHFATSTRHLLQNSNLNLRMAALCLSRHTLEQNCELSVQCLEVQGVVMETNPGWNKVTGAEANYYKGVQITAIKLV